MTTTQKVIFAYFLFTSNKPDTADHVAQEMDLEVKEVEDALKDKDLFEETEPGLYRLKQNDPNESMSAVD
jgi:hypothetical protein